MCKASSRWLKSFACAAVCLLAWQSGYPDAAVAKEEKKVKSLFELTKIHDFELTISEKEYGKMQPAMRGPGMGGRGGGPGFRVGGGPFGGPGGPGGFPGGQGNQPFGGPGGEGDQRQPASQNNGEVHRAAGFGQEYPWVHADFAADGKRYDDVGVRYKGNFTYAASANSLKRSLKIDFDRYDDDQHFHGLKKLNLNSGVTDPARLREALAFAVFRAADVPAPRTAFARLTLTVPGKYDKEFVGLYTLIEQVDSSFLKNHFGSAKGLLLKPEGIRGLMDFGDDWAQYAQRYLPKEKPTGAQKKRLIEFVHLVNQTDDAKFNREIGSYLDVDAFLRFLATNALVANLDSFLGFGHNYYLYLRPDTNQFVFIPWDLDLAFGIFPMAGPAEQQADLSIVHPHVGENKLIDRLLANKEINAKYQKVVKEIASKCFTKEVLQKQIDTIQAAIKDSLERESKAVEARHETAGMPFGQGGGGPGGGPGGPGGPRGGGPMAMFGQAMPLSDFIAKRTQSVATQLEGKSKGYVPQGGGFGPMMMRIQPGQVLPPFMQDRLQLSAEQRKKLEELQKEVDAKLGVILTDEQRKRMKEMP